MPPDVHNCTQEARGPDLPLAPAREVRRQYDVNPRSDWLATCADWGVAIRKLGKPRPLRPVLISDVLVPILRIPKVAQYTRSFSIHDERLQLIHVSAPLCDCVLILKPCTDTPDTEWIHSPNDN
jgi:hypothetical protein